MFTLHNKNMFAFYIIRESLLLSKKMADLSADSLILAFKIIFSEYGLPKKIMSDVVGNLNVRSI